MESLFLKILNMSINASWIVLFVLILRFILKKAPKNFRVILWALVAVRLVCPYSFESVLSLLPSAETIPEDIMLTDTPEIHTGFPAMNTAVNPIISDTLAPNPGDSVNPMQVIIFVSAILWITGMAVMLAYTLVSYLLIRKKTGEAVLLRDNIYLGDRIATPFILGVIKPKIYLPSDMNEADTEYVTAHEKAHIKRKDHLWKPLGFLLLTVYWFNPVLWLAYVLLTRDIELACDEKVIGIMGAEIKKPYAEALVNCSMPRRLISACPVAFGETGIKGRIKSVLSYKKPALWVIIIAVLLSIAAAVGFLTDPIDYENDISELDYENAINLIERTEEYTAIYCPEKNEENYGGILIGEISGAELSEYLSDKNWNKTKQPYEELSSPGSVEFVIEEDYRITVYERKTLSLFAYAKVRYNKEVRYYRVGSNDYDLAVRTLHTPGGTDDNKVVHQGEQGVNSPWTDFSKELQKTEYIDELRNKYPFYFDLPTENGLAVYVWQMSETDYQCTLISGNDADLPDSIIYDNESVSVDDMKIILESYDLPEEKIVIKPAANLFSSYVNYVIPGDCQERINALFGR